MSNQSSQSKYDSIPHSGDPTPTPGTIVFQNGKVIRVETVTTISAENDTTNRATEFNTAPEVDDSEATQDIPDVLLTPPGDNAPNSCTATNVAPEKPQFDQECLGAPNQASILTAEEINALVEDKAKEVCRTIHAHLRYSTIPMLQSGADRECLGALMDGQGELEEALRVLHLSEVEIVKYYLKYWA